MSPFLAGALGSAAFEPNVQGVHVSGGYPVWYQRQALKELFCQSFA